MTSRTLTAAWSPEVGVAAWIGLIAFILVGLSYLNQRIQRQIGAERKVNMNQKRCYVAVGALLETAWAVSTNYAAALLPP